MQAITRGELSQTKAGDFVNWRAEVPGDYIIGTVLEYDLAVVTQYGEKLRLSIMVDEGQSEGLSLKAGDVYQVWERTQLKCELSRLDIRIKDKIGIEFQRFSDWTKIFAVQVTPNEEGRREAALDRQTTELRIQDAEAREKRIAAESEKIRNQPDLAADVQPDDLTKLDDDKADAEAPFS